MIHETTLGIVIGDGAPAGNPEPSFEKPQGFTRGRAEVCRVVDGRIRRTGRTVEFWNPYTTAVPAGAVMMARPIQSDWEEVRQGELILSDWILPGPGGGGDFAGA